METALKCHLCSETFGSLAKLNAHIERQHQKDRDSKKKHFQCNVCGKEFSTGQVLTNHIRTHTGERPFKCQVSGCEIAFKQESALKTHIKYKHSDERPLKCAFPGCPHTAKSAWNLKAHKELHSDERPFACHHSRCNFRAKSTSNLLRHEANVHRESKTLTCSQSNYKTNIASNLARHMIVHEERNEAIPCSIDGCEYKGRNSVAVKKHMARHKMLLPCPVSECGRYLPTKEALENHLQLHNPSGRAQQCPLCFKHFPTLVQLQQHCVVHTNEKPFQCEHCTYEAATRTQVKNHISSVHAAIEFPFIVYLLDERECVRCKLTLPSSEFVVHCKDHVDRVLITYMLTQDNHFRRLQVSRL